MMLYSFFKRGRLPLVCEGGPTFIGREFAKPYPTSIMPYVAGGLTTIIELEILYQNFINAHATKSRFQSYCQFAFTY